ncbi:MAG: hypothetical protein KatS3mg004_1039 [Bryobacteraceae bacterium]|nr:MAG: hypothetical protein KatS3mg004_1039 [Bryobacteraceae bacterium]
MELLKNFWKEEEGQDLIEYALLLGFISLAVVTAITGIGTQLNTLYTSTNTVVTSAAS